MIECVAHAESSRARCGARGHEMFVQDWFNFVHCIVNNNRLFYR